MESTLYDMALEHLQETGTSYFIVYEDGKKVNSNFETDNSDEVEKKLKYAFKNIKPEGTEVVIKSYLTPQSKNSPFVLVLREGVKKNQLDGLFPNVADLSNPQLSGVSLGVMYGMQMATLQQKNFQLQQELERPQRAGLVDMIKENAPAIVENLSGTEGGQQLLISLANLINTVTAKFGK
jgi:hypothetical protein